jgi:hypothetical protein
MTVNIVLDDFELLSHVDGGGAGDVYRATHKRDLDFASVLGAWFSDAGFLRPRKSLLGLISRIF